MFDTQSVYAEHTTAWAFFAFVTVTISTTGDYDNYDNGVFVALPGSKDTADIDIAALTGKMHYIPRLLGDGRINPDRVLPGFRLTTHNALEFFCDRGLVTVLNFLAKREFACGASGGRAEHRPNKSDIASGALQDIGARGFGFADTSARFYARWGNKEKRKQAGFSYNFDTFALRTDYNKLPAAQDAKVMLDTYRVGIMPDIGKRHRLFAGVDNYRNGILAIQYSDAADTDTHTNIYKLGSVAGKGGYAVKFEWRVVWD